MKKLLIILTLLVIPLAYAEMSWQEKDVSEWSLVEDSEDGYYSVSFDKNKKKTSFCFVSETATKLNDLPKDYDFLSDEFGNEKIKRKKIKANDIGTQQDKYGYCYDVKNNEKRVKFGSDSIIWEWKEGSVWISLDENYEDGDFYITMYADDELIPEGCIQWIKEDLNSPKFWFDFANESCSGDFGFPINELNINVNNVKNNLYFEQGVIKTPTEWSGNQFYKRTNEYVYLNVNDLLNSPDNNNLSATTEVRFNHEVFQGYSKCVMATLNPVGFYECLKQPYDFDVIITGNIYDTDPELELTYDEDVALGWYNRTEFTALGARLDAPVLFMDFNKDAEGTYVQDNSIENNFGTESGATWGASSGYDGSGGYDLDGSTDYIYREPADVPTSAPITIAMWIRPENLDNVETDTFISIGDGDAANDDTFDINTNWGGKKVRFYMRGGSSLTGTTDLTQDVWQHIAVTLDESDHVRVYLNGILDKNATVGTVSTPNEGVYIGVHHHDNGGAAYDYPFNGKVDNVIIDDRVMSAAEILQLYNGTINNSDYIGKYARDGDFRSLIFYNSTSTYWNVTFDMADTYSTRTGVVNNTGINLSDVNLVSYWNLDANYNDVLGINNGTPTGTNNATGISSGAMRFDGVDDYISATDDNSLDITSEITLSAWIYPLELANSQVIIQKGDGDVSYNYYMRASSDGSLKFISSGGASNDSSAGLISANQWHHAVITFDGTNVRYYVDGAFDSSDGAAWGSANANPLYIGWDAFGAGSNYFNGSIDEVLIYNKTLSAAEVQDLYKAGLSQHANTNITLETRTATSYNISDTGLVSLLGLNGDGLDEKGINNGTVTGTIFNEDNGVVGEGAYFSGNLDIINITDGYTNTINGDDTHTVSIWLKPESVASAPVFLYATGSGGINGYFIEIAADGGLYWGHDQTFRTYTSRVGITNNEWIHLAMVKTGAGNSGDLYVNGILNSDYSGSFGSTDTISTDLLIGWYPTASVNYTGGLDELRIYNRSLSAAEVLDLYELGDYHIEWGVWQDEGIMDDGTPDTSTSGGNFIQFRANFNTDDTNVAPWVLNHSVGVGEAPPTPPAVGCPASMEGNGSLSNPCVITNCTELQNMSLDLSANYSLGNDIDCSDTINWDSGAGFNPVGSSGSYFYGNLDGKNNIIDSLYINRTGEDEVGLIGGASGNSITNIGLNNTNISGNDKVGGLIGTSIGITVTNTYIKGYVTGSNHVGGITGKYQGSSLINNTYVSAEIIGSGTNVGGLIGEITVPYISTKVYNSYAIGSVIGTTSTGGLIGKMGTSLPTEYILISSFASNNVTGDGGLIGTRTSGKILDSYWYNHSSNPSRCYSNGDTGCTAVSTSDYFKDNIFPSQNPMDIWGFYTTWGETVDDYPCLDWTGVCEVIVDVTIDSPQNNSIQDLVFLLNISEDEPTYTDSVWYSLSWLTNITYSSYLDLYLSAGTYDLTVFWNDTEGDLLSKIINFTVRDSDVDTNATTECPDGTYLSGDGNCYSINLTQSCVDGYVQNGYYTNGTIICVLDSDSNETERIDNLINMTCGDGEAIYGFYINGTPLCRSNIDEQKCRYTYFGYYNLDIPFMTEANCIK